MIEYKIEYPNGTRWLWLYMAFIVFGWICVGYVQMPLVTPSCVPRKPDQEGYQTTYEDCAAFARFLGWVGNFIHEHHDDIIALATAVVAVFTFTLWRATDRLWQSAERQLSEFRQSLLIANEHAGHMAAWVGEAANTSKAARDAFALSREEFIASHRPIIVVYGLFMYQQTLGKPAKIRFAMYNKGASEAKVVDFTFYMSFMTPEEGHLPTVSTDTPELGAIIEPGFDETWVGSADIDLVKYLSGRSESAVSGVLGGECQRSCRLNCVMIPPIDDAAVLAA